MAKVYIWGDHDLTGHASISTPEWYVSFHPNKKDRHDDNKVIMGSSMPVKYTKLQEDMDKWRNPLKAIDVPWLKDNLIKEYIEGHIAKDFPHYSLFHYNCSAVVARVMFKGAGTNLDPHKTVHGAWDALHAKFKRGPLFQEHSERTLEDLRDHLEDSMIFVRRSALVNPLARAIFLIISAADVASRGFIWTPGAVKILAEGWENGP